MSATVSNYPTDMLPIPGMSGYLAGSDGGIYSTKTWHGTSLRRLTERLNADGYAFVQVTPLGAGGRTRPMLVHRAVALAFMGDRPAGTDQLRHLNGDKCDNRPMNLRWGTAAENAADRERHGRTARGERNGGGHRLTAADVAKIRSRIQAGEPQTSIASAFGVSQSLVGHIAVGRLWRGVG